MAGVELLYKPSGCSVLDLRSNLANDLRQRAIAKKRDGKNKECGLSNSSDNATSNVPWSALSTSDLSSLPPSELIHSRINESVYKAKNALASVKVPDVNVEDIKREYIQKVGRDYSTVGLTSYIIAQKDAKEFRERCFFILSWRPKTSMSEGSCDSSDSSFFCNRKTQPGRPMTPDEVLLGSFGKGQLAPFESSFEEKHSPTRKHRTYAPSVTSPFAIQAKMNGYARSNLSEEQEMERLFTIGQIDSNDNLEMELMSSKRPLGKDTSWSDSNEGKTPEKMSVESQQNQYKVVEEILEEHKDLIPQDLDVKTLGYAEKRKLLKQLGFQDDYIANRLCDRYMVAQKRRNTKLTPLEAFSMYDRQDLNESIQVHKDLSVEFSRYSKGTEPYTVKTNAGSRDVYDSIKAVLMS
ncbi:hypothetical protein X943_002630 [Babesia divergens]|uniref:Uncharacterized protein n=1 Tax=Babesia divergens TaxID=32595 RepID=A0AAD9LJC2_BABDI|nr:hypothetical protein X943_002630 [Babesia divergens]